MSFYVIVRFKGDPKRAHAALREDADLEKNVKDGIFKYGMVRTTRLIGDGEFIDIDEWKNEADRDAFVAEMGPELKRWNEVAGITNMESTTWRPPANAEEDF